MAHILLVNSDSATRGMYRRRLEASGIEVSVASSDREALEQASAQEFDIVLIDLNSTAFDGIDLLRRFREEGSPYHPHLKLVVFMDIADTAMYAKVTQFRVNGFISRAEFAPDKAVREVIRYLHQFEEQRKNADRLRNGGPKPKKQKILLVEDEDVFADMFGRRLRDEGYVVEVATNGTEGFEKASIGSYDLIITDLVMPGLNGRELSMKLKENEKTKNTPVFLFSASVSEDVIDDLRCEGMKCFMKTHVTPSELVREVNSFLGE